jgi:hypothetical protein
MDGAETTKITAVSSSPNMVIIWNGRPTAKVSASHQLAMTSPTSNPVMRMNKNERKKKQAHPLITQPPETRS